MGRKRRSTGSAGSSKAKAKDAPGANIKKMESYEDTLEEGGVDDYMFKRDQIMFDPRAEESDDDINGEEGDEVLGLNVHQFRRGDEDEDQEMEDDDDEETFGDMAAPQRKVKAKADLSTRGRFGKTEESDSDEFDEDEDEERGSGSESEEEGWGRQYYSRPSTRRAREDDDVYDEEKEERRDLEEKEVRKLQKRAREAISGAEDWGLDDVEVEYAAPVVEEEEEVRPVVAAPETDDPETLLRHMQTYEPLKLALARDFPLILRKLKKTAKGIAEMDKEAEGEETLHKGLGYLHYQTLVTYATTLAFYLHLCALPADERPDLSTHPIVNRLLDLKQGLAALEDLDFDAGSVSDKGPELFVRPGFGDDDEDEDDEALMDAKRELMARMNVASGQGLPDEDEDDEDDERVLINGNLWNTAGLDDDELKDLLADQEQPVEQRKRKRERGRKGKKGKKEVVTSEDDDADIPVTPSAAFTPLAEPEFISSSSKKGRKKAGAKSAEVDDTFGDLLELSEADAGDKEQRKRSLQFHTSKIAQMSARRSAARERRLGGDDDIPYRDRQAARDAALRKNGPKGTEGADLDGSEWTDSDRKRAREVREEADADGSGDEAGAEGYYDLVKRRKVAQEDAKADAHEAFREAKFASFEDETADGPRSVTRAIEKNRGLTPRRSKTGRNPRVKKRQAYDKAKQKVASQRAVYKGGQSSLSGAYSGEKSGISTISKSRKF